MSYFIINRNPDPYYIGLIYIYNKINSPRTFYLILALMKILCHFSFKFFLKPEPLILSPHRINKYSLTDK